MNSGTHPTRAAVEPTKLGRVTAVALRVYPSVVAVIAGLMIGVFVVLGTLQRTAFPQWSLANLDAEASVAMWFSAGLLWAGALWWLLVAVNAGPPSIALWVWWPILAWLALDEGNAFHERLESSTGIDWQILYLPVMAFAGTVWVLVVRRFSSDRRIVALLLAGATVWGVALALELGQHWGGAPVRAEIYNPAMIIEEGLEMVGSTVLLIAAILALRRVAVRDSS